MNFNWNRVQIYTHAKESDLGNIRVSCNDQPVIALKKYGYITWEPLNSLSGSLWRKYRNKSNDSIHEIFKDGNKIMESKAIETVKNEAVLMVHDLYNKLDDVEKKIFLEKHKNTYLGQTTCSNCLENCLSETKQKCVNYECAGMCEKCHEQLGDKCSVCNADQVIECPICQETKEGSYFCNSAHCRHSVCFECCGRAFQSGHPIMNCPLCRGTFTENQNDVSDDDIDYGDMPELTTDDEIENLIDMEIIEDFANSLDDLGNQPGNTTEANGPNRLFDHVAQRFQMNNLTQSLTSRIV